MKQKKPKSSSARTGLGRKRKDLSDVSPSTSLPPLVEGQLRCFLKLTVSKIMWTVSKPPTSFVVRVRWWGETSDGTIFIPQGASQIEQKTFKTTTRYPIRCGPKQFTSYLTDMGALVLEVMTRPDHLPIGRVQICGLSKLSPSHPISGFFTIVSPTSEKMGELQVSLVLEPLSETYDSSSSVPNTDVSFSVSLPAQGTKEATDPSRFLAPSQLYRPPSIIGSESISSSRAPTPRGKDHLYFPENSEHIREGFILGQEDSLSVTAPKHKVLFSSSSDHEAQVRQGSRSPNPVHVLSWQNSASKDLLSALLDRGKKLRNAMVASAMKSSPDTVTESYETHPSLNLEDPRAAGKNLENLNSVLVSTGEDPLQPLPDNSEFDLHAENRAIQLLLGSSDDLPMGLLDGSVSPPGSVSLGSEVYASDLNDPHYDQSLLENLFYKAQKSDSSLSDFLSDEEGPVACKQRQKRQTSEITPESASAEQRGKAAEAKASSSPGRPFPLHETATEPAGDEMGAVNLNLDRLAMLGRIHLARVVIDSLRVPLEGSTQNTPGRKSSVGKPPKPTMAQKRTFFVEYHFPVKATKNGIGQVAITTEIIRVASSKISNEVVKFQQRYVFPVHFSGMMITHWWNSDLAFNIYLKKGAQRKPLLIGSAVLPLRGVIQSEQLTVSRELPVEEEGGSAQLGPLKVSLELAADNKDFSSATARAANVSSQAPVYSVRSPGVKLQDAPGDITPAKSPRLSKTQEPLPTASTKLGVRANQAPASVSRSLLTQTSASEEEGLLLHVLLMVPEGKDFVPRDAGPHGSCNIYLNCKLFSTDTVTRSAVMWGTRQPAFRFSQVTPISLTSKHLERLKNNVMVIEAWNKRPSPGGDQLLGLVKLPLHQFYMSFKDPKISALLLQAQYPVVAVDGPLPVVDVFTGSRNGSLKVILAMGSADQIVALQRLKNEEGAVPPSMPRSAHSLDPPEMPLPKQSEREGLMEHVFEVHIESVKGLTPLQSTVWGEADCYVQYHFPVQESETSVLRGTEAYESSVRLKPFRSATTLCVPDPTFNDERHHSLLVPADVPVQRLLLSAVSEQGLAGGGGIQFEIWCRYYYPNVRDQMVARGTLSLARLCAMVTMQRREEVGIQTFSLPLISRTEGSGEPRSSGLLDVSIKYRCSLKAAEGVLAAQVVSISIQIHRAAGLQAAARALAEKNPSVQYSAEVGVNAYVMVHFPFLPDGERRSTRTVARTFCPEFEHHAEFTCSLVIQRSSGETCCLGELLQFSEAIFSIFHQNLNSGMQREGTQASKDYLLGTIKMPTRELLIRRSGIRGWYPITLPDDLVPSHCANVVQTIVGGLELSVTFARPGDRERVLEAAALLGWNWEETLGESPQDNSDSESPLPLNPATVTVSIPRLWLPVHCALLAGQTHVNKGTYFYLRYKLYDQEATWTSPRRPRLAEDQKHVTVAFNKSRQADLPRSQALLWYFREERLEFQVWRAYGNERPMERPLDTDRLIGSAYVDLSALGEDSRKTRTVSGVYPLFRRSASNLSGAAVRIHIALSSTPHRSLEPAEHDGSSSSECGEERKEPVVVQQDLESQSHKPDSSVVGSLPEKPPEESPPAVDPQKTFAVSILVERAMHLSLKGSPLTERGVTAPSSCVSFVTANTDSPISTEIVEKTDSPVWDFQLQTRLSNELLLDPQQTLVFKVWHKADAERVIGFASVDLSPLLSGFQLVCGWYNITDFSGQCQGQIKVAISPLENIIHLKEERQARSRTKPPGSAIPATSPFAFQARGLCAAFSTFSTRGAEELFNPSSNGTVDTEHERSGSPAFSMPRHEEHVQNIRRFHESLQQAEGNAHRAGRLDSLSQASRTSLLRALRKNLNELDEIKRYFNQKLTRSFPDTGAPDRNTGALGARRPSPASRTVDSEGRHLLEKSNHLLSQVSNLINGLQNITENATEPSNACEGLFSRLDAPLDQREGAARTADGPEDLLRNEASSGGVDEEAAFPLEEASCGGGMLYEFLGQAGSQSTPSEGAAESHSEDDYEEDIVEPRTLNEITTVTDKTSPWSSFVSEEPDQEAIKVRETRWPPGSEELTGERAGSSSLSSVTQEDPLSVPSTVRSSTSPSREEAGGEYGGRQALEGSPEEPCQSAQAINRDYPNDRCAEEDDTGPKRALEIQTKEAEVEPGAFLGGGDVATSYAVPKAEEGNGASHPDPQDAEGADSSEEELRCSPGLSEPAQQPGSCSDEGDQDPPEDSGEPLQPRAVLSDPVVVPNFFLPPQHLEASLRLLSVSAAPLTTAAKTGRGTTAGEVLCRKPSRRKPSLAPADLPEEETKRIARIFSAQFSKR
ncbi:C2 domain-containing protein 3 [Eublepharis macularius]|uniref:C2 domain-containing protein 3 n=1 Tax=Eublepharis macularius TaxID=481883 RepID=A0AA97J3N5_EUBMA|nr:C2 domain-containing protein 3 [Eublepharis macularius]